MSLLLKIRFKSLLSGIKSSFSSKKAGVIVLYTILLGYAALAIIAMLFGMWFLCSGYLQTDYAWLYFALVGIVAFALGIFGTVFTTQSQMYEANDNELLLAMPIKPFHIIMSRVLMLFIITLIFSAVVMVPAGIVYLIMCGCSVHFLVVFPLSVLLISMVTQAVTCLLGWVLHFLLARFKHKALVAAFFMSLFLVVYFVGIGNLDNLTMLLKENGGKIANALQSFGWPFYVFGQGCMGDVLQFILFALFTLVIFGLVMWILTRTFVKAMLAGGKSSSSAKQKRDKKIRTPEATICRKECKRFFSSTTYLVNLGLGLFLMVALVGAGVVFKDKLLVTLASLSDVGNMAGLGDTGTLSGMEDISEAVDIRGFIPVALYSIMGFIASMTTISAPSVSLEGKHLWILRSMPISGAKVLRAKLRFHCIATVPLAFVGTMILGFVYDCSLLDTLFASLCAALLHALCGVLGLVFNMCFPRMDWPTEATPCKNSMAVGLSIFGMMFLAMGAFGVGAVGIVLMGAKLSAVVLALVTLGLALITYLLYLLLMKWGGKKFETL